MGIGTASPSEALDVVGNVHASGSFIAGSTTTYGDGSISNTTGSSLNINLGGAPGDDLIVHKNTLVVQSAANRVGIGTATPRSKLEVNGDIRAGRLVDNDDLAFLLDPAGTSVTNIMQANSFTFPSSKTRFYSVGDGHFFAAGGGCGNSFTSSLGQGGSYIDVAGCGIGTLTAPVSLPQGAVVTGFQVWFVDDYAIGDLSMSLFRKDFTTRAFNSIADLNSTGTSPSIQTLTDTTIVNATIDNTLAAYHVAIFSDSWSGTNSTRITGALITYSVTEAK